MLDIIQHYFPSIHNRQRNLGLPCLQTIVTSFGFSSGVDWGLSMDLISFKASFLIKPLLLNPCT